MLFLRRPSFYFFIVSLVLHGLVIGLLVFFPVVDEKPLALKPLEFELRPSETFVSQVQSSSEKKENNTSFLGISGAAAKRILSEGFKMKLENAGTAPANGETIFGEGSAPKQNNESWVEQVEFTQGVELTTFFRQISDKIDRALDFPEDMAKERIQGDVRVDFYVNNKGQLLGDFHSVKGSQQLLNLYVMSSLLVLLKDPLPENLWSKDEGKIAMSVHVHFETYQFSEMQIRNSAAFQSNELSFTRARYVIPLAVAKTEKFFTRYIPPIIPIPGGFYVDLVMLAKYVKNLNTPDPDDQRRQRLTLTREGLELATKKKNQL